MKHLTKGSVRTFLGILSISSALFLTQCATFYHANMMRGTILKQQGKSYYICIGTENGAKAGQNFKVYSYKDVSRAYDTGGGFEKIYQGVIKITTVVNKHYAKATLVKGKARKGDVVEIK